MNLVQYGKSRLGDNWEESLKDSKDGKCFSNLVLVITFYLFFAILFLIIIIVLIIIFLSIMTIISSLFYHS